MHVHVGVPEFLAAVAYMIIAGFAWRTIASRYSDTALGQAMAYIY